MSHDVDNSFLRPFVPVRYLYVLMKGQTVSKGGKKSSSFSKCQWLAMCVCVKENKWNLHLFANVTYNAIRTNCDICSRVKYQPTEARWFQIEIAQQRKSSNNDGVRLTSQVGSLLGDMMS